MALDKNIQFIGQYGKISTTKRKVLHDYIKAVFRISNLRDQGSDFFKHRFWAQIVQNPNIRTIRRMTGLLNDTDQIMKKYNKDLNQAWEETLSDRAGNDPEIMDRINDLIRQNCFF